METEGLGDIQQPRNTMSIIKSFAVGFGDMYYINHGSDNFTIIDCFLNEENETIVLDQIVALAAKKGITRFISTHPDNDHLSGIEKLDARAPICNFYCVKNKAIKDHQTDSFDKYCELRDSDKAYYISKDCERKWMNLSDDVRGSSGINVLWPNPENADYQEALAEAEAGGSPNNMSAIIRYAINGGGSAIWFGDLHMEFTERIEDELVLPKTDIVFAPHHGRKTGRIPTTVLEKLAPKIIVIGEAATEHLHYYSGYNTITQNSAGDVIFDFDNGNIDVFTSKVYNVDYLENNGWSWPPRHYVGSFKAGS